MVACVWERGRIRLRLWFDKKGGGSSAIFVRR